MERIYKIAIVDGFIEVGGNFIDTANGYSGGESERMLGMALKKHNQDNLVAGNFDLPIPRACPRCSTTVGVAPTASPGRQMV